MRFPLERVSIQSYNEISYYNHYKNQKNYRSFSPKSVVSTTEIYQQPIYSNPYEQVDLYSSSIPIWMLNRQHNSNQHPQPPKQP